jgi:2-methylisocitrate lyase-like PEP mutase family enzyme
VTIPVTADVESGYAENNEQLKENIKQLIETGIVGINIEDTDKKTNSLLPVEIHAEKIQLIKKTSDQMGVSLFINARTDVYVRGKGFDSPEFKLEETLKRGSVYKSAGADCFYPITLNRKEDIKTIVEQLKMPVNVLVLEGIPALSVLGDIGVARVSLGPGFLKIAVQAMRNLAIKLQSGEGTTDIIQNEVTSAYLKDLVKKN